MYGIHSSDRIGRHGVPCVLLFQGGLRCVVNTKKETKRNQWAKIKIIEGGDAAAESSDMKTGELLEILGPVGDFDTELYAYQLHFNILPCRYPSNDSWGLLPALDVEALDGARQDCTHLHVLRFLRMKHYILHIHFIFHMFIACMYFRYMYIQRYVLSNKYLRICTCSALTMRRRATFVYRGMFCTTCIYASAHAQH
jgi:hypothetical protein